LNSSNVSQILVNHIKEVAFAENNFTTSKNIVAVLSEGKRHGILILDLLDPIREAFFKIHFFPSKIHDGWYISDPINEVSPNQITMADAISKCRWPIKLSELSNLMGIPSDVIKGKIADLPNYSIRVSNSEEILNINKVKRSDGMRFILRKHGRQLPTEKIKIEYKQLFKRNVSLSNVGTTLGAMEDALSCNVILPTKFL